MERNLFSKVSAFIVMLTLLMFIVCASYHVLAACLMFGAACLLWTVNALTGDRK